MAETYEIVCQSASVGTARLERQGLYCCFSCRCSLPDEGMYRVHVICGQNREDLGICVPMEGSFGMDKRIPTKRLGEGALTFELVPKDWQPRKVMPPEPEVPAIMEEPSEPKTGEETFIPVSEEEPFEYLDKLEDAIMEIRDDQTGVVICE